MQPLLLTRRRLDVAEAERLIQECLAAILERTKPRLVILFGSAARQELTDQSDLDFLLVFDTPADCRNASAQARQGKPLGSIPVDLICVPWPEYVRKRDMGGVCMIAAEDGRILYHDPNWDNT